MEMETKTRTERILKLMKIVAWIAFICFMVEGGAMITSFLVSCINSEGAKKMYKGLNFYDLKQFSFWHYTVHIYFLILLSVLKAYVWFLVMKILSDINLTNPFKWEVANRLEKIGYVLFITWLVAVSNGAHTDWLQKATGVQYGNEPMGEYLFMAGLVFIISQVFKRGIEIQSENELTV